VGHRDARAAPQSEEKSMSSPTPTTEERAQYAAYGDIWNPWHGCRKCSEGCQHCYMYYLDAQRQRRGDEIYRVKTNFNLPIKKDRAKQYKIPSGAKLRVCMTSDFFLEEADPWRGEVWDMIRQRPDVQFWLLTKRAARIADCLPPDWGDGWDNVHLNVSTENQARADERLSILLTLPAKHKGFMCAPLLSEIHVERYLQTGQFESVLADGENYDGARPCRYEWVQSLSAQCAAANVPFTFVGTGNVFIKDGRTYHIPKAYQSVQAQRAGLNYPPTYADMPIQKKCAQCRRRFTCNGCTWCGRCGRNAASK
jgi:protein gp37